MMKSSFQLLVLSVSLLTVSTSQVHSQTPAKSADPLHEKFLDPPRDFSPMPFWFWNGKMEAPVIQKQIRDMADQHVYGAFLHARDGLETPYLSEAWWDAIKAGLEQSKSTGFEFNFVDEYDWPSGEARNVWMAGNHQSEVLAKRPDLRMKTLAYEAKIIKGQQAINLSIDPDSQAVVVARWLGKDQIDATSLTVLNTSSNNGHFLWTAPEGEWVVLQFSLKPAMGFDGGFVDLMNPESAKLFLNLVYDQYFHRFGKYFGNTIHYAFSDHEGDYGYRIAWTPSLYSAFQERAGYDLRKMLPLLIYDGGDLTTKVRTDYLATVTDLYGKTFWSGITKDVGKLGIGRSGHAWEESLQWSAALQGNLFTVERGLNPVGVDSLGDFGRQPLNFKVAQSVADFEGRRFVCENQGVQGTDSYLDLEAIRKGTNGIGAWGVNLFIPHAFNYDPDRANYPPDWLHQPYWPYFHTYADYTRRISYMNADSHHATNVLLYYPITTLWSETEPLFSGTTDYQEIGKPAAWKNESVLINDYYTRIILEMSNHHWDYNIADDQYIESARVEGNELVIGPQRFTAIVIPPITTLSRKTLLKLQEFHKAGGTVIGIRLLPTASPEAGDHDSVIASGIKTIFGTEGQGEKAEKGDQVQPGSGKSYFIQGSVNELIATLDAHVAKDVEVKVGPAQHLFFEHRQKLDTDYYWVVNDTDRKRINEVHFATKGIPEKWNALTGAKEPLFYVNGPSGTDVRLNLDSWDAFYVVFHPLKESSQEATLLATNAETLDNLSRQGEEIKVHVTGPADTAGLFVKIRDGADTYAGQAPGGAQPFTVNGNWQFRPQPEKISVPYAKVSEGTESSGVEKGWTASRFDDTDWQSMWLNEEQNTVKRWQMIGPFPNTDNDGFAKVYPPEQEFDPKKKYDGIDKPVSWQNYDGDEPNLALADWSIWMKSEGGSASDSGYVAKFNPVLLTDSQSWIVSYAHTYLYSPIDQHAQFIVAADNWAAVWLNSHKVFSQLRTPFWYEQNDKWADRIPVDLHKGWNEVLVKVGKGRGTSSGFYGFTFRVADKDGATLSSVTASTTPGLLHKDSSDGMRWYRIEVPPGCVGMVPPVFHGAYRMLLNGEELVAKGETPVDLRRGIKSDKNTLVMIAAKDDPLVTPIQFLTGDTFFALKSWTQTGLANFSGTAIYTKSFSLPESFRDKRVRLDLGRVSSVADVYVNGAHAGTLVWRPYQLDITDLLKPGENEIKILVTNTEANQRAVGTWHHVLASVDISGMEGPVQLIPYIDRTLTLSRSPGK
jgi:hypothetical protein